MARNNTHFPNGTTFGMHRFGSARGRPVQFSAGVAVISFVPIAYDRDGICASQTPSGAGNMTLNGARVTSGVAYMDVPRCVSVYGGSDESGKTFLFTGKDEYGQTMSELVTGPNNTTVYGAKAFWTVTSVYASAATAGAVEIGFGDKFGLPFKLLDVPIPRWNGTLAQDAGTYVPAVTTDPATTTTGDVRGTYAMASAPQSNGSKRLTLYCVPFDIDSVTRADWYGVTQA